MRDDTLRRDTEVGGCVERVVINENYQRMKRAMSYGSESGL